MDALLARFRADARLKWGAIGVGVLAAAGVILYFAAGGDSSSDSLAALAAQMLAKTALVLGLLFLTLAGLKRWQTTGVRTRRLSVVETLRLSPRQSLHLVRVGERYLLIGASESQVSLLTEVTELPAADAGSPSSAFVQLLDQSQKQL
jgi:flagellar biosynthetic protein FliO